MFFGTSNYLLAALLASILSSKSIHGQLNLPSLLGRMDEGGVAAQKSLRTPSYMDCISFEITGCFFEQPNNTTEVCSQFWPPDHGACEQNVILSYSISNIAGEDYEIATPFIKDYRIPNYPLIETTVAGVSSATTQNLCVAEEFTVEMPRGPARRFNVTTQKFDFFGCESVQATYKIGPRMTEPPTPALTVEPSSSPSTSSHPSLSPITSSHPSLLPTTRPSLLSGAPSNAPSMSGSKEGKKGKGSKGGKKGHYNYQCEVEPSPPSISPSPSAHSRVKSKGHAKNYGIHAANNPSPSPYSQRSSNLKSKGKGTGYLTSSSRGKGGKGGKGTPKTCNECLDIMDASILVEEDSPYLDVFYSLEVYIKDSYDTMTTGEIEESVLEVLNGLFKAQLSGCSEIQSDRRRTLSLESDSLESILNSANFTELEIDGRVDLLRLCEDGGKRFPGTVCRGGEGAVVIRYSGGDDEDVTGMFTTLLNNNAGDIINKYIEQVDQLIFKKIVITQEALTSGKRGDDGDRNNGGYFKQGLSWIIPTLVGASLLIIYGSFLVVRDDRRRHVLWQGNKYYNVKEEGAHFNPELSNNRKARHVTFPVALINNIDGKKNDGVNDFNNDFSHAENTQSSHSATTTFHSCHEEQSHSSGHEEQSHSSEEGDILSYAANRANTPPPATELSNEGFELNYYRRS